MLEELPQKSCTWTSVQGDAVAQTVTAPGTALDSRLCTHACPCSVNLQMSSVVKSAKSASKGLPKWKPTQKYSSKCSTHGCYWETAPAEKHSRSAEYIKGQKLQWYLMSECVKFSCPTCSSLSQDSGWSRISEFPVWMNRPCLQTGTELLVISMSIMLFFSETTLQWL